MFELTSSDTIMLTSAITFDAALLLMFLSWVSRSTLMVVEKDVFYKPIVLAQCLKEVTVLQVRRFLLFIILPCSDTLDQHFQINSDYASFL